MPRATSCGKTAFAARTLLHESRVRKKLPYLLFVRIPFWTVVTSILLVTAFRWIPVRSTPLMLKRSLQNKETRIQRKWVPLEEISPDLIQAVIASEDNRFAQHHGFDREELEKMWADHKENGKRIRGCSTISQQVAKNVFTFGTHTWVRKATEAYWTVLIETVWGKRRIMEVYLNIAETGPALFGVEASAERYYGKKARDIDRKQACSIAASLPAPVERAPDRNTPFLRRRRAQIHALIPKLTYPDWAK